ncbi:MAG TPA: phosphoadenylyl-sulfate reductase [Candidatus Dormibacteraeota bacterium]|nr:phosphoadenylyl-sulfate reductase [Candidatus Dormibacteraeota bacterium]
MTLPAIVFSEQELVLARALLGDATAADVIAWALARFAAERRVVVTGLQSEGVAVADMAIALDPSVRVLTIDTGRLPQATHEYLDTLRDHWGRGIEVIHPDTEQLEAFTGNHGTNPFYASAQLRLDCCHVRKVAPLDRALKGVECWLTGVRRGQSAGRATAERLDIDLRHRGIVKVNPLATWTGDTVHAYLREHGVPVHPLYAQGYTSIGCAPCTRPVSAGEDARAGRWWWESGIEKECGIHATPVLATAGAPA